MIPYLTILFLTNPQFSGVTGTSTIFGVGRKVTLHPMSRSSARKLNSPWKTKTKKDIAKNSRNK